MGTTSSLTREEPAKDIHWAMRPQLSTTLVVAWVSTVAFGIVGMVGFGILLAR
jgi:hypothetical protein